MTGKRPNYIMPLKSFGENHKCGPWTSRTQTISTCRDVCDKACDKSTANPFVSL